MFSFTSWLNGSLFAAIHATVFFYRIWTSGQNFFRKIFLQVSLISRKSTRCDRRV
jgi:hypothetical protein